MTIATPAPKKRILFVDDEPAILAGLQNLLYKDRRRWEMTFALSGEIALEKLSTQAFDVVVSDMRMPGMDGATLLNRIKEASPSTARIMLSGHAEREAIVRALPALHQLLAKPCDAATLRATIERSLEGEATMHDARVRAVIGKIDKLPSPPQVFERLSAVMSSTDSTIEEIAAVVANDPSLSAKVLQLVNSAYFGSGQRTSSIADAVTLLGTEQLRYIGVTASVFSSLTEDPFPELPLHELQKHAVCTGTLARRLMAGGLAQEAFAGGLLHDVGRVVLAVGFPAEYREIIRSMTTTEADLGALELAAFGATHAEVGACLLGLWGLPAAILDVVRYHDRPGDAPEASWALASAVHVAEALSEGSCGLIDLASVDKARCTHLLEGWRQLAAGSR
ncbi:MAG: HDOD domain-containing protein [Myxococcales bacterium]|nr:HDOD domain-containing protein [Myxococcales bacterium]